MIRRIYVEKIAGEDGAARACAVELREHLGVAVTACRMLVRYDVEGLSDADMARCLPVVFSEPQVDRVYQENFICEPDDFVLPVAYLPGQFDQRADSAAQCAQLLCGGEKPRVACATVWVFSGVSAADHAAIRAQLINPVESCEASLQKPATLDANYPAPDDVPTVDGFTTLSADQLTAMVADLGLAMDGDDLAFTQAYFRDDARRDPTLCELRLLDTYWSDHCRHTTFTTVLDDISTDSPLLKNALDQYQQARERTAPHKPVCLMDLATLAARDMKKRGMMPNLDDSKEINACSVKMPVEVDGEVTEYLIQFKNETHNHPTEIEPFGGAATCLGGAIRDPLSGRAYVYQAMRITGAGDPRTSIADTLPGKLPQRRITQTAAAGFSSYGNQIGLATGQVTEYYHPGYVTKRMELGAVIAAVPAAHVRREEPDPGDVVLLLGGATGRDGCGGATGSSKAHTADSLGECGAEVQKGNPPEERKLQRLFRNPDVTRRIKRCNDFGAGGVSVAIGELADGLSINLDAVPKKYEGLGGIELAISESQERMAIVVAPEDAEAVIAAAAAENLSATLVAAVTAEPAMVMTWRGKVIANLPRRFLDSNGAPRSVAARMATPPTGAELFAAQKGDIAKQWSDTLGDLNVCLQKGLAERFDSTIGTGTVLMPFGGRLQLSPSAAMVGKVPVLSGETDSSTAMSWGFDPYLSSASPFHGGLYAVVEALSRIAAVGADVTQSHLTLQEYFPRPNRDPDRFGLPLAALLGAFVAQQATGLAAIGGKDSMSGSFGDMDVPPTLVAFAVAPTVASKTVISHLTAAGQTLWHLPLKRDADGMPNFEHMLALYAAVHKAAQAGRIQAASPVAAGGLAATLTKMAIGEGLGLDLTADADWFTATYGDLVIASAADFSAWGSILGQSTATATIQVGGANIPISQATQALLAPLESTFPTTAAPAIGIFDATSHATRTAFAPQKIARPRVVIPVFPGTNCEYDSLRAMQRAGAVAETLVIRNRSQSDISQSIAALAAAIEKAQIIFIPGGFSGGDEPDGSAKFIVSVFRNAAVRSAVDGLLTRGGLMLGICNGFQALMKLGLLPYGYIRDEMTDADATLTFNHIGRHVSQMVYTQVASTLSPWLAKTTLGQIDAIPVSHGEGRVKATAAQAAEWAQKGQIAFQYVDLQGNPAADTAHNPPASLAAIEGLTSPDGRILGKMGHSEREGQNLYRNIPITNNQKLFLAGVEYFS